FSIHRTTTPLSKGNCQSAVNGMTTAASARVSADEVNRVSSFMIIRLFWFLIPNHKFYEYALISKQCDILNVFLMFLFKPCLM
ncbi:hypothetical protein SEEH3714_13370, partial [Salmonella enterica subsp. enterica serovar Heidelberg str. 622737-14]